MTQENLKSQKNLDILKFKQRNNQHSLTPEYPYEIKSSSIVPVGPINTNHGNFSDIKLIRSYLNTQAEQVGNRRSLVQNHNLFRKNNFIKFKEIKAVE